MSGGVSCGVSGGVSGGVLGYFVLYSQQLYLAHLFSERRGRKMSQNVPFLSQSSRSSSGTGQSQSTSQGSRGHQPEAERERPEDGINYHVQQGQTKGSWIYVSGDFGYHYNQTKTRNGKTTLYLRCKYYGRYGEQCKAHAQIKDRVLTSTDEHRCSKNVGASAELFACEEIYNRIKRRIENDTSWKVQVSFIDLVSVISDESTF